MDRSAFSADVCPGQLVELPGRALSFLPNPLPPEWRWTNRLVNALTSARAAVDKLSVAIPSEVNPYLIAFPLMYREAYYSSRMEGTYTTPKDLALFEVKGDSEHGDTREVVNYVRAMQDGARQVTQEGGLGLSQGLIKRLHHILLDGVRGEDKKPGQYRVIQNFIGRGPGVDGARFVPPPTLHVAALMDDLEKYLVAADTDSDSLPLLVDIALIHYQFETIHPFNDGNGRIGRLLIPLTLISRKRIQEPLLYVSAYLDKTKDEYIGRMFNVSTKNEWEEWVLFFLRALEVSAGESLQKAEALLALRKRFRDAVITPRSSALMCDLVDALFKDPALTFSKAQDTLKVSQPQASSHVRKLEKLGIVEEKTGGSRNLVFVSDEIWNVVLS